MAKDRLFNMRVTEDWINERRQLMKERTGMRTLTEYLMAMVAMGESLYDGTIREEECERD